MAETPKTIWKCNPFDFVGPFRVGSTLDDAATEFGEEPWKAPRVFTLQKYGFKWEQPLVFTWPRRKRLVSFYFERRWAYRLVCDGVALFGNASRVFNAWESRCP